MALGGNGKKNENAQDAKIKEFLESEQALWRKADDDGITPLHNAIRNFPLEKLINDERFQTFIKDTKLGGDVTGKTILYEMHSAVDVINSRNDGAKNNIIKDFLELYGKNVATVDEHENNIMHLAATYCDNNVALLSIMDAVFQKLKLHAKDNEGKWVYAKNKRGATCYDIAKYTGIYNDTIKLFPAGWEKLEGRDGNPIMLALRHVKKGGKDKILDFITSLYFLADGFLSRSFTDMANEVVDGSKGNTALHMAAYKARDHGLHSDISRLILHGVRAENNKEEEDDLQGLISTNNAGKTGQDVCTEVTEEEGIPTYGRNPKKMVIIDGVNIPVDVIIKRLERAWSKIDGNRKQFNLFHVAAIQGAKLGSYKGKKITIEHVLGALSLKYTAQEIIDRLDSGGQHTKDKKNNTPLTVVDIRGRLHANDNSKLTDLQKVYNGFTNIHEQAMLYLTNQSQSSDQPIQLQLQDSADRQKSKVVRTTELTDEELLSMLPSLIKKDGEREQVNQSQDDSQNIQFASNSLGAVLNKTKEEVRIEQLRRDIVKCLELQAGGDDTKGGYKQVQGQINRIAWENFSNEDEKSFVDIVAKTIDGKEFVRVVQALSKYLNSGECKFDNSYDGDRMTAFSGILANFENLNPSQLQAEEELAPNVQLLNALSFSDQLSKDNLSPIQSKVQLMAANNDDRSVATPITRHNQHIDNNKLNKFISKHSDKNTSRPNSAAAILNGGRSKN